MSLIVFGGSPKENLYVSIQEKTDKPHAIFNLASMGGGRGVAQQGGLANICDSPTKSHKSALSPAAERHEQVRFNKICWGGDATTVLFKKIQSGLMI